MNCKKFDWWIYCRSALGVAAGLLMAPYSGQKARKKLVEGIDES